MTLKLGWLLLLFISAAVRSVPIDRNVGNQEQKEEVQEESVVSVKCCFDMRSAGSFLL